MFRNLKRKRKKFQLEKRVKNEICSTFRNFVFALYILITLKLQIVLKFFLHILEISKSSTNLKNTKKIGYKYIPWDPNQNLKNAIYLLEIKLEVQNMWLWTGGRLLS